MSSSRSRSALGTLAIKAVMAAGGAALVVLALACTDSLPEIPAVLAGPMPEDAPLAELQPVTYEAWQNVLAAHQGQVVVVDVWATWCVPCIERFPRMVGLARKYEPEGVTFISLSLDDRDDPETIRRARAFLAEQDAGFDHFRLDEEVLEGFSRLGLLSIPAVMIYDREGGLAARLTSDDPGEPLTEEAVEAAVRSLLPR